MTAYETMLKANYHMISGKRFTEKARNNIVSCLLDSRSSERECRRFYLGVNFPDNTDTSGRRMYPEYFIPPYNDGKKYPTLFGAVPQTHILSANSYELEIIRLLWLLAPENEEIGRMKDAALARLRTTCFGNSDDGVGECYDTSLVVLRFLAACASEETMWIRERIRVYHTHFNEKKRHSSLMWYFLLCLSELPLEVAEYELNLQRENMVVLLSGSYAVNSERERELNPVMLCAVRNALARIPQYEYIAARMPYTDEFDGKLHFDLTP